jgi:hypothetical protein
MKLELILHHAKIYTQDPARPWAEAVACAQGRIVAVGSNEAILGLAEPQTQRIDLAGQLVLPGLIDAHVHFLQFAIRRHQANLFGVTALAEVEQRVAQAVAQAGPGQWVQGWGWDEHAWDRQPEPGWLDRLAPHNPLVLARLDMHTWWVNQAALQQAGLDQNTPDPPESRLERDATGRPTGILREWNAIRLVEQHLPKPDEATLKAWLESAIGEAHRLGLTGIHDQRVEGEGRRNLRLLQALQREGKLRLRVHLNLAADFLGEINRLGLQPGFGNDRLWLGHVKVFADGTLGSRTASMLEPFEGEPDNYGLIVTSSQRLAELAAQADQAGFSLSIHAIGDRAVREVIDVLSEFPPDLTAGSGRLPHRIEHVQTIHPLDMARLAPHQLVASMQPVHLMFDHAPADRLWGRRGRYTYAFRSLLDQGVRLALGSDAPVAPLSPLLGIQAALTRQDEQGRPAGGWYPAERISLAEAIAGYTLGPADLAGKAPVQGSISPGKWADMIVLARNLFEIPAEEIGETEVRLTVFNGQVVYAAG